MERLILFDIDGTLTRTQNGYLPFNEALCKTFGIKGDIRTVVPDGNTDPLIVKDIFATVGMPNDFQPSEWDQFTVHLHERYRYHMGEGTISVKPLPGAAELLEALSLEPDFVPSVVTGNFEATAQVKLDAAGLASYLWRGAYASDSEQRRDLPAIAKNRCEVRAGRILNADRCIIIGDTPKDVEAARANHMKCVLVGTGRYPVEELEYWQAEACLPDLRGTGAILDLLANL